MSACLSVWFCPLDCSPPRARANHHQAQGSMDEDDVLAGVPDDAEIQEESALLDEMDADAQDEVAEVGRSSPSPPPPSPSPPLPSPSPPPPSPSPPPPSPKPPPPSPKPVAALALTRWGVSRARRRIGRRARREREGRRRWRRRRWAARRPACPRRWASARSSSTPGPPRGLWHSCPLASTQTRLRRRWGSPCSSRAAA